jgi:hypothetical protein
LFIAEAKVKTTPYLFQVSGVMESRIEDVQMGENWGGVEGCWNSSGSQGLSSCTTIDGTAIPQNIQEL